MKRSSSGTRLRADDRPSIAEYSANKLVVNAMRYGIAGRYLCILLVSGLVREEIEKFTLAYLQVVGSSFAEKLPEPHREMY